MTWFENYVRYYIFDCLCMATKAANKALKLNIQTQNKSLR